MTSLRYRFARSASVEACLAAGPVFVIALLVLLYVDQGAAQGLPVSVDFVLPSLGGIALLAVPVIAVGTALAAVPVAVGTVVLRFFAERVEESASPGLWLEIGAALAGGAGWLIDRSQPDLILALAATGAACAGISRRGLRETETRNEARSGCSTRPAACTQGRCRPIA